MAIKPSLILFLVAAALGVGVGMNPGVSKLLYDKVFVSFDKLLLIKFVSIQLFMISYSIILGILYFLLDGYLNVALAGNIRIALMKKVLDSDYLSIKKVDSGFIVKRIADDAGAIADGITKLVSIVCNILLIGVISLCLYYVEDWLFYIYVGLISGSLLWMFIWIYPIHFFNMKIGEGYSSHYKFYWELLQGIKEIKLQNLQDHFNAKTFKHLDDLRKHFLKGTIVNTTMWQYATIFYSAGYLLILLKGLSLIAAGKLSIGLLLGLLAMLAAVLDPVQKIYTAISVFQSGYSATARIMTLLDWKTEPSSGVVLSDTINSISLQNVSFSYDESNSILRNVSFSLSSGDRMALIGKTGCGKSTLVQLLSCLFRNYNGNIYVNDLEVREANIEWLRNRIVLISQDVQIFSTSIKNNIDLHNALSSEIIEQIINDAQLNDVISKLDDGIETTIGDGSGIGLSGGELQRISVARCLASKPDIVILDEFTSSLDPKTEKALVRKILDMHKNSILIAISHRASTICDFNKYMILENGMVSEFGSLANGNATGDRFKMHFSKSDLIKSPE